ncbi:MAG: hypothetical protein AMJ55_05605 [Gammaproteobacteria bacterium SG8_15]|nr:MAG: hypothetical protein AMJ55_05605 [Gammaproteobacteria bacterium SG8_15]
MQAFFTLFSNNLLRINYKKPGFKKIVLEIWLTQHVEGHHVFFKLVRGMRMKVFHVVKNRSSNRKALACKVFIYDLPFINSSLDVAKVRYASG